MAKKKYHTLKVRMTDEEVGRLSKFCEEHQVSMSEVLRIGAEMVSVGTGISFKRSVYVILQSESQNNNNDVDIFAIDNDEKRVAELVSNLNSANQCRYWYKEVGFA